MNNREPKFSIDDEVYYLENGRIKSYVVAKIEILKNEIWYASKESAFDSTAIDLTEDELFADEEEARAHLITENGCDKSTTHVEFYL